MMNRKSIWGIVVSSDMFMMLLGIIFCYVTLFSVSGCSVNEPYSGRMAFTIQAMDASVTETFIKLNTSAVNPGMRIELQRDHHTLLSFYSNGKDTIITDTSLTENTYYSYVARAEDNGKVIRASNEISVKTLLPSGHDFEWTLYEFGELASSDLIDVTIVDDNNIWASGMIYHKDGRTAPEYRNIVHWDGKGCELLAFPVRCQLGSPYPDRLPSITNFGNNNIWFASEVDLAKWDGDSTISKAFFKVKDNESFWDLIGCIGGFDENNIYLGGWNGGLFHYTGNSLWNKIETGTATEILNLWPYTDISTGKRKVFCAVSSVYEDKDEKILVVDEDDRVSEFPWLNNGYRVNSVWTKTGYPVLACGDGVYMHRSGRWVSYDSSLPLNYVRELTGTGLNDIFAAGDFGLLAHYNGRDWVVFDRFQSPAVTRFNSVAVKGNTVSAVGFGGSNGRKAILLIGKRKIKAKL